jgi:Tol biopolymer transport system component
LLYEKDHKFINEHNVTTNESSQIMYMENRYLGYSLSSTGNWLASVKEVPRQSENPNAIIVSYKNQAYDLFILNLQDRKERRITTEGYVSGPWWKSSGDTVFFYMDDLAHYAFVSDTGSINYGFAKHLNEITIRDYLNCVDGRFPYIQNCQILLVDLATMKPIKFLVKKRGRYDNVKTSSDGKYIIYTQEKQNKFKIYLIEDDK